MKKNQPYFIRIIVVVLIVLLIFLNIDLPAIDDTQQENMGKQLKSTFAIFAGFGFLMIGLFVDFIVNLVKKRRGLMIFDGIVLVLIAFFFVFGYFTS